LRLTVFDVGQGDASLLQLPEGSTLMVDAGGIPFGGSFDIGGRVLAPAMWARGVRSLDALLLTHGDPDHIGGAPSVIADFQPRAVWQGVPVAAHLPLQETLARARAHGGMVEERWSGEQFDMAGARIHVLHPAPPDWERQKVRNDDSVVIEVLYGNVAVLMTGDIEADVERELLPKLVPASIRILKVAHHGSRTSSSRELLERWRPQFAIISCGRGNRFGHPAADVLGRLTAIGATLLRTDLDGEITVETDGSEVQVIRKLP
jgi:competence protein ComEC